MPLLFMDASKPITIEDALCLLGLLVVAVGAYLIFRPRQQPWQQQDKALRPTGSNSRWFARLFESEGEPSIRLVLAALALVFALTMVGFGRLNNEQLNTILFFVDGALLIGSARIVGKAWAARPPAPDTQIKADSAPVTGENVTVRTDANANSTA